MAKPKDLTKDEKDEAVEADAQPGSSETMRVQIAGPADRVTERLGLGRGEGADSKVTPVERAEKAAEKFFDLLQDVTNACVVSRTWPPAHNGVKCDIELKSYPLPEDWKAIQDHVRETYGGGKFRGVITNMNGRPLSAQRFEIPGDPILPQSEEFGPMFDEEEIEESPLDKVKQVVDREIESTSKEMDLINARRQLAALRDGGKKGDLNAGIADAGVKALEQQIAAIERKAVEDRYQRQIDTLQQQIAAGTKPAGESASDKMFQMMMAQMKQQGDLLLAQQKSSDDKFSKLMEQAQNQKLDAITSELRELKRTKDEGGLKGQIEMVKTIADLLGVPLGGKDDEDDDRPWHEKLIEDSLPRVLDMIDGKKKEGKEVTKEELIAEIEKEADKQIAAKTEELRKSGKLPAPQAPRAAAPRPLPPPAPTAGQLPPPAPSASLDLPPAAPPDAAAPPPAPVQLPPLDEERKLSCAQVMMVLEREVMIRRKEFQWNFIAWQNLPEDLLERFSTAADLPAALATFDGILNPAGLDQMRAHITADEKVKAYVARGYKELQGWWQESLKNPDFDPADDGEEGGDDGDL